jgi:hypothetical protein
VENDPQQTHEHLPRGAKAVIDARAATRLSAVVGDGEFAEFAVGVEEVAAKGPAATTAAVMRRTAPVAAIGAATLACLWAGARMNHNFSDMAAHAAADGGSFGRLNAAASPMFGAGRDRGELSGDPAMNLKNSARVAAMAVTAAVTANGALAGDAVQWRVADGGNGHWYQRIGTLMSFTVAQGAATVRGAHLATCSDAEEWVKVLAVADTAPKQELYFWIGLYQDHSAPDFAEPTGGWRWVDGTQLGFSVWLPYEPNNTNGIEDFGHGFVSASGASGWNDTVSGPLVSVFEWSADCNSDGIVDYGQCHDGTLPDYNGNNIPDCCERREACVVGNYPVQWRVEDGGNEHWYAIDSGLRQHSPAQALAAARGANLATITSAAEDQFVFGLGVASIPGKVGVWLGGLQPDSSCEPGCGWAWVTSEKWSYTNWAPGEPNNQPGYNESRLHYWSGFSWNDAIPEHLSGSALEWSADCNSDNIVDYGQILNGQLPDTNSNGIPDCCEPGNSCCLGDIYVNHIVDGGDLGVLLSEWGVVTPTTRSDLNRDGFVDGADLGRLLANWGPCGG